MNKFHEDQHKFPKDSDPILFYSSINSHYNFDFNINKSKEKMEGDKNYT